MRTRGLQNHQGSSLFVYAVVITSILLGLTFRIAHYCSNRSLWFDEAQLALHIVNRSFSGLTQPLDNMQGAPIGFLMIEKAFVSSLGNADYVLRLFPLLSGCVSL